MRFPFLLAACAAMNLAGLSSAHAETDPHSFAEPAKVTIFFLLV